MMTGNGVLFALRAAVGVTLLVGLSGTALAQPVDPLPSWNDGPARARIVGFVKAATEPGGKDFVAPAERIVVIDNDGTLWSEQPMYVQLAFALDRVKALAPKHPEWKTKQPFKAALERDLKALAAVGEKGLLELLMATHAGTTSDEFAQVVRDWVRTARDPKFNRPYTELIFQPMRELLDYLRANGFKAYIVSGGGVEFMRAFAEAIYGVPPEQVIGSSIQTKYELRDGKPVIVRLPEIDFVDDKAGKPVGIHKFIGRRPVAAFGNSDGDFEMLEWTTSAPGGRLGVLVHHDDAEREYAYDRKSAFGKLERGLDEAGARGWLVVSMKKDWRTIYPAAR
jgi:phosphoglycolate phosphatase-like HAD superfamily hydrolase